MNHKAVEAAFETIRLDVIVNLDVYCDTAEEAAARRNTAKDVLAQNGIEINEEIKRKIDKRYEYSWNEDKYKHPFHERHLICMFSEKTGKYENGKIETNKLPF